MIAAHSNTPPPEKVLELMKRSGSLDQNEAIAAQVQMAEAIDVPLRKINLAGSILGNIFASMDMPFGEAAEYPLDLLAPGMEREYLAYAVPAHGKLPQRVFNADYIMVPIYEIGSSISWPLRLLRAARYDVHARAMQVYEAGYVAKDNNDGFACLLTAAANRNILAYDQNAGAGRFTLKLISLMQQAMRRQAGGNTTSLTRGKLTDLFMSIELIEDMRSWTLADVNESTREQIANSPDGFLTRVYGVNLHDLIEFGVGQQFQNFYTTDLGGSMASGDVEILLGLDLQNRADSFVNPIRTPLQTYVDDQLFRERKGGVWGVKEHGFAVLDNRKLILGSA